MGELPFLARKIKGSRWDNKPYIKSGKIRADSVTDLKSSGDTLSFWRCDNKKDDAAEALLAVAAEGSTIEKLEVVLISEDVLNKAGYKIVEEKGNTPIIDIRDRHVDLVGLDNERLVLLAQKLKSNIDNDFGYYTFTKPEIENLFINAYQNDRFQISDLPGNLQQKVIELFRKKGITVKN